MTTNTERMSKVYPKVREALREIYPDFPWNKFYDADRAVNWELWHGPLPDNYWTYVEPLEHYEWKGWEKGLEDLRAMLEDLPGEVWYDGDAEWISLTDPNDDEYNWAYPCKFCGELLRYEGTNSDGKDIWVDDTQGDVCSGNDDLENENEPHEVDYYREGVWFGSYDWYKVDTAQATLYDEVWKML